MSLLTARCRSLVVQQLPLLSLQQHNLIAINWTRSRQAAYAGYPVRTFTPGWTFRTLTTSVHQATWEGLDLSPTILARLRSSFDHIESPTPAQEALLCALKGHNDVFLRDAMGRGKTFILALAALHLIERGERVMILVPTPQLVNTIRSHLDNLSPTPLPVDLHDNTVALWLSTPKQALSVLDNTKSPAPTVIMVDEPETLLSPLPPRHLQPAAMRSHPFIKHPPRLVSLLDCLVSSKSRPRPRTIWVGAELNGLLKRTVRQRGWAGRDALELDFSLNASLRSIKDIESVLGKQPSAAAVKHVETISFTVDSSGNAIPHDNLAPHTPDDLPPYRTGRPVIEQGMIDAVIRYQQSHPTPPGTITLLLPPEGYPLDLLSARLSEAADMTGHVLNIGDLSSRRTPEGPSVLVTSRSSIPGLDIPNLARVILLNGLDLAGLSPTQRSRGGVKRRLEFHDIVRGRMGRLGSVTEHSGGQVVIFASIGSGEEVGLEMIRQSRNISASVPEF